MNSKIALNVSPSSHTSQTTSTRGIPSSKFEDEDLPNRKNLIFIMKRFLRFCNYAKCLLFDEYTAVSSEWMKMNRERSCKPTVNMKRREEKSLKYTSDGKSSPKSHEKSELWKKIWKMKLKRNERRKKCYNLWIALLSACRLFNFLFTQKYSSSALARSIQLILLLFVTSSHYSANK